jgi:transcriptional regulator with XRE-family HTH domain
MGTSRRPRPARLAAKLTEIRTKLGLTQAEMFERLGNTGTRLYVGHIDDYEKDRRVPTLQVVLAYARAAGVSMEMIVDDNLDLPNKLKPR